MTLRALWPLRQSASASLTPGLAMLGVFWAPPVKKCKKTAVYGTACFQRNACPCSWMSTLQFLANGCVFCLETQVWHGEDFPSLTDVQCLSTSVRMQEDPPGGLKPTHGHPAGHAAGHPVCVWHRQGRQTAGHHHHQREQQLNSGVLALLFSRLFQVRFQI